MKKLKFILLAVLALFISATVAAQNELPQTLTLPAVVGDNMVLQHSTTVNIWGYAKPRATVKVKPSWLNLKKNKAIKVKANAEGLWVLPVQTPAAGFDAHTITITCKKEVRELKNVVFGEVWLCAGQSNMEWPVSKDPSLNSALDESPNQTIRLFSTGRTMAATPQMDVPVQRRHKPQWSVCNAKSLKNFSAVAYGFGKELQENLNVPIGLIDASYGGTPIESWLSVEYLTKYQGVAKLAKKIRSKRWRKRISYCHNANIYPIRYTTIAGVIWYQGCANVTQNRGYYGAMLKSLIKSWREEFCNPDMPFYIVQIAPHIYDSIYGAIIRETQARIVATMDYCELVVTNDQNQIPGDIHPPMKADVAHRLAQCALGAHYKKSEAEYRSPAYKSMEIEGNAIRVQFKNVPTTLVKKGEGRINGFYLGTQSSDPKKLDFCIAEATIEADNSILVTAEGVTNPVAVRYCFNEDMGNVFSAEGLPLAPFRSDKNNRSNARPYVEKPAETPIKFVGEGYVRSTFEKGAAMWPEKPYAIGNIYPKEFEGFQVLAPRVPENGQRTAGGSITALADGKIYIFMAPNKAFFTGAWHLLPATYIWGAVDGRSKGKPLFISEREVKAGETVELPKLKKSWGCFILAKSIEY